MAADRRINCTRHCPHAIGHFGSMARKHRASRLSMESALGRVPSVTLFRDERIHRENGCLRRENFLGENAVNLLVGVEAGVLEDYAAEVEVGGAPQRGERNAAGGNSD